MVLPRHIAVIPDGNRRFARSRGLDYETAYRMAADKVEEFLEWVHDYKDIKVVTVYTLSTENLARRSPFELQVLYRLLAEKLRMAREDERIHKRRVRVLLIGDLASLPRRVVAEAEETMRATSSYNDYHLVLAMSYGGRREIVEAVRKVVADVLSGKLDVGKIDESALFKYMYTNGIPHPEPDLIIRTGGERRLSNFLLYQGAYAELYFIDKYWPEITREDLDAAIRSYVERERRFGG